MQSNIIHKNIIPLWDAKVIKDCYEILERDGQRKQIEVRSRSIIEAAAKVAKYYDVLLTSTSDIPDDPAAQLTPEFNREYLNSRSAFLPCEGDVK